MVALLVGVVACDTVQPTKKTRLVVEGFWDAGEPLPVVTLRRSRAIGRPYPVSDSTVAAEGADVNVRVSKANVAYEPVPGQPGQYAPASGQRSQHVTPRSRFYLSARWHGQTARASGGIPPLLHIDSTHLHVPEVPVEAILLDSLRLDTLNTDTRKGFIYPVEVTVWWTSTTSDSTLWVRPQLMPATSFEGDAVDFFLRPDDIRRERSISRTEDGRRRWTGVYAVPVQHRSDPFPAHRLRISVLRSYADYAQFTLTRQAPEQREPISNVKGGLGIVAGIAVDSLSVTVQRGARRNKRGDAENKRGGACSDK